MNISKFHDKYYKHLLIIPLVILLLSLSYIGYIYVQTGDFSKKDISLTGGTSVTLYAEVDVENLKVSLGESLENINTRRLFDLISQEQKGITIETTSDSKTTVEELERYLGYELTEENSSIEFTGSALSESFYQQLLLAILAAFFFMAIVVFILFRTFIPSLAVVFSAFANIVMALAIINLLGMPLSSAGIVAFLMLIGYSVDTDILLTTRLLKRSGGSMNSRIFGAAKTGLTMTFTSLFALIFAFFIVKSFSLILFQIFSILIIGLCFDLINTWITNVSILKWYLEKKK
jgi:preprotein translocase subunit SecF